MSNDRLLLVDSNALIHRAYHALPPNMATHSGELTNAVYGFTTALLHALETVHPTHVVCCFDVKGDTFRHADYDQYKAHRKAMDNQLVAQIPRVHQVVEALEIPIAEKTGYEADDLIGTLAKHYGKHMPVVILTGDKDTFQLIDERISVLTMKQGMKDTTLITAKEIDAQYGITPDQFIVYKALRGDPSDNIPGVSGVGEVTALKLVREYHALDELYKALDQDGADHPLLKGKLRETLIKEKDMAYLSQKLATIDTKVPFKIDIDHAKLGYRDVTALTKLFDELEFNSLKPRIHQIMGQEEGGTALKSNVVVHKVSVNAFEGVLKNSRDGWCLTYAWQMDAARQVRVIDIALAKEAREAWVVPYNTDLKTLLLTHFDHDHPLYIYDCKLFWHGTDEALANQSISFLDLMIQYQLTGDLGQFTGNLKIKPDASAEMHEQLGIIAASLVGLRDHLATEMKKATLHNVWEKIERPLTPVLYHMEQYGVALDTTVLQQLSERFTKQLHDLEKAIWHAAGQEFNIASPAQLRDILFDKLQIASDGVKKKKTGLSTDAETLEGLHNIHPIVDLILQYRELSKLKNTYLDVLPTLVSPTDKRLHTTLNQIGSATGRISSNDPNLQNIPIRTEYGDMIRKAFVAKPGYVLLSADYSQIELRILAHLSKDKAMQQGFKDKHDIHLATAAKLHGIAESEVTKEMRRAAKTINFGLLYGLSTHRLSIQLGIDFKQAKEFMDRYFDTYPKVRQFLDSVVEQVRRDGYYQTIFGRRRLFPEISASAWAVRQSGERMAMNFPMQGTQADILKLAMIEVHRRQTDPTISRLLLSVHDELLFEVHKDHVAPVAKEIAGAMTSVCKLDVPLEVSVYCGSSWGDLEPVE